MIQIYNNGEGGQNTSVTNIWRMHFPSPEGTSKDSRPISVRINQLRIFFPPDPSWNLNFSTSWIGEYVPIWEVLFLVQLIKMEAVSRGVGLSYQITKCGRNSCLVAYTFICLSSRDGESQLQSAWLSGCISLFISRLFVCLPPRTRGVIW